MATEKNITMKQFNGTDYDTLYPKTIASQIPDVYSKTDTITTETLSQLGLSADKLPNDAFQQIKILIDNAQTSADGKAKIQTGSYVGTGTYGANNPCSLTFDFEPSFIFIVDTNTATPSITTGFLQNGLGVSFYCTYGEGNWTTSATNFYFKSTIINKTISWSSNYGANIQLNISAHTYNYIAI